jgi:hypothetical protein
MTFFAEGANRNSRRCVLNSRCWDAGFFDDAGFLRADGMAVLLSHYVRHFSVQFNI